MAEVLIDSYDTGTPSNQLIVNETAVQIAFGQSFHGDDTIISRVEFNLVKLGSPTGNLYARLYAHTGTYGSTGKPTGSILASSDAVDGSAISTSSGNNWINFVFSGANKVQINTGTNYFIVVDADGTSSSAGSGNGWGVRSVGASPTHSGNAAGESTIWTDYSAYDTHFKLYGTEGALLDTIAATTVNSTRATLNGDIQLLGAGTVDERGFVYSTSSVATTPDNVAPTVSGYDSYVSDTGSFSTGTFSELVLGLNSNSIYYYRAFAHNAGGYSYGDEVVFTTTNTTTVTFSGVDVADIFRGVLDSTSAQGSFIDYDVGTTEDTGVVLSYTFKLATGLEGIKVAFNLAPSGWYWYTDLGTNTAYFKNTLTTATHKLIKGRHLANLKLRMSIQNVKNKVYFTGGDTGGGVNLFSYYSDADSINEYGPRIDRRTDNRVTLQGTADAYGDGVINTSKDEAYYTEVDVLDSTYDITLFKPGDTVGFRGFGNFIESLILQIVRIDYTPEKVRLYLGTMAPRQSSTIEQVRRDLLSLQTVNNPSTPS